MSDSIAKQLASLSPEARRAELARRLAQKPKTAELSFAQERMWFLDRLAPGNPSYNMPAAVRLAGRLDVAALRQSLEQVMRRHETLRTTFAAADGRPVQVIAPAPAAALPVVDLQDMPGPAREACTQRLVTAEAQRPFDLTKGPLLRATLLQLGEQEHVLLLTMHHIVSDGWSVGVLIRELAALYPACRAGQPSPLPALPLQYADFARWQRGWLQGEVLETQLAYWKQHLDGAPTALELPTDRPRPPDQTVRGARRSMRLDPSLSEALKALSRRAGVTLFVTLLAAFKTLLYRYTGQDDLVVGTPIANRNRAEIEGLIGFFVNTLALRTDLSGNPTFLDLLGRVREVTLGAYAHQDLPFEKLVGELRLERDVSRAPLFQVMFVLQNAPMPPLELPDLVLSPLEVETGTAKLDLSLIVIEQAHGLKAIVEYSTDLFEAATIARLMEHWRNLLEGVVQHPDRRLADLPLLSEAEYRQVVLEWNATGVEYPPAQCLHEMIEAQAERIPDAVALTFGAADDPGGQQHLTFAGLDRRANQLARYLRRLGVRPETLVGICVERSLEMIVGLVGILKAGGAYVPLDPAYPQERLTFMIQDAQAPVLLTQQHLQAGLPPSPARVVCLDADWPLVACESDRPFVSGALADNLAYVIYTSGSTGRPKGTLVGHTGLCNLVRAQQQNLSIGPASRVLQFASLNFDASAFEIFLSLASGAALCMASPEALLPGPALARLLRDQAITFATLPPSALAILPADDLPALQTLISAGEACSAELVARWAAGRRFINGYGPTEASVCTTLADDLVGSRRLPIGRPIPNVQVYILDAHWQPVPVGVPGELYIGGVSLARGYLNRPDLTAERFIPNPFSSEPGARLYKTGDLTCYRPDGQIEFLGRLDHQVKLRGFRIELGEIEAVLVQHSAVREGVALVRSDPGQDKRLIAYAVPKEGQALAAGDLRRFVQDRLPAYMVPSAFVILEALPLLPNGKVDRRALPAPDSARPAGGELFVAPRGEAERTIAQIWQEVLGVEKVGVNDNFFDLGGHSLLIAQVHQRLATTFKQDISLTDMFKYTTVAALAARLSPAQEQAAPDIVQETREQAAARRDALRQRARRPRGAER